MLSHLGDQLRERHRTLQQAGVSILALPTVLHSLHRDPHVQKPSASDIPSGFLFIIFYCSRLITLLFKLLT
jgi:hypothetical protein